MTNDNPSPPAEMPMLAIEMNDELWIETLEMMIAKLDEVIHDFSKQEGVSITTRSRISRDMAIQRAALVRSCSVAKEVMSEKLLTESSPNERE
jgi:hypothetical protein